MPSRSDWNELSSLFLTRLKDYKNYEIKGTELIPIFLNNILPDTCSLAVGWALEDAIKDWVKLRENC